MSISDWTFDNQIYAFAGSISHMAVFIWTFKQLKDKGRTKQSWKQFWRVSWDDLLMILFLGQTMAFMIEYLFGLYANNSNNEKAWDAFIDNVEAIMFLVGVFGVVMFKELLSIGSIVITVISKRLLNRIKKENG